MIKSLYSGVTGLKTHNQRMDVIGNNIANVNTTAFKAGTVTFKDVYYQTRQSASGGSYTQGGINPSQVGYGVQLGAISKVMTQSGMTYSDSAFDCALEGSGFFQVMDSSGNTFYTRLGRFTLDDFGNLVDANGNVVLGVSGDPTNVAAGTQRINIAIPDIQDSMAFAVSEYLGHDIYIRAGGFGPGGNIAITIQNSETPFASMSGANMNVFMDLSKDYESIADANLPPIGSAQYPDTLAGNSLRAQELVNEISRLFSEDLREAIRLGGVNIDAALEDIAIEFSTVPEITAPLQATNYVNIMGSGDQLTFTVNEPGAFGNKYEIQITTNPSASFGYPTATWKDNILVLTLPSSENLSLADIQEVIDDAARRKSSQFAITVTGGNVATVPNPAFEQYLLDARFDSTLPVDYVEFLADGVTPNPDFNPQYRLDSRFNSGLPVDYDEFLADGETPNPDFNPEFMVNPQYVAGSTATMEIDAIDTTGMTSMQKVRPSDGKDSFFSEAFGTLQTMRLNGGYFHTIQDPSSCEIHISEDGVIYGKHPVHGVLLLGRIDIVDFINTGGLLQVGTSYFVDTLASGPPQLKIPQLESDTFVISGALEMSNVDLSNEFSDMIITQRGFQANSRIITVSDSMLEELVNLKR